MLGRKVVYVRCMNCSYNNAAKGTRLLDKKKQLKNSASKSFWKIYPFTQVSDLFLYPFQM